MVIKAYINELPKLIKVDLVVNKEKLLKVKLAPPKSTPSQSTKAKMSMMKMGRIARRNNHT